MEVLQKVSVAVPGASVTGNLSASGTIPARQDVTSAFVEKSGSTLNMVITTARLHLVLL